MLCLKKWKLKTESFLRIRNKMFSTDSIDIPTIDINKYLKKEQGWEKECKTVSDCLYETGILVVKDPVIKLIN